MVFTPRSVGVFEKSKIYKFFLSPLSSLSFLLCFLSSHVCKTSLFHDLGAGGQVKGNKGLMF